PTSSVATACPADASSTFTPSIPGNVSLKITACFAIASARFVECGPSIPASLPVTSRPGSGAEAPVDDDLDERRAARRDGLADRGRNVLDRFHALRGDVERARQREEVDARIDEVHRRPHVVLRGFPLHPGHAGL